MRSSLAARVGTVQPRYCAPMSVRVVRSQCPMAPAVLPGEVRFFTMFSREGSGEAEVPKQGIRREARGWRASSGLQPQLSIAGPGANSSGDP